MQTLEEFTRRVAPVETIRDLRKQLGLSQRKFAQAVGRSERSVIRWENQSGPLPELVARLVSLLSQVRK